MAFVFLIIGVVLITSSVRGTSQDLFSALQKDFLPSQQASGQHSFLVWAFSILVIGLIGYAKPLQGLSRAFLALVIIVLILSNKGFFTTLTSEIRGGK